MKKIVAAVCAAMLVVSTAVTAFAAGSTSGTVASVESAKDKNDSDVSIEVSPSEQTVSDEALQEVLGSDFNEDLQVLGVQDVTVVGDVSLVQWPVTITFKVDGVTVDSVVYVLHYKDGKWNKISATPGDGTITATFDSLSPVAFIIEKAAEAPANTEKPGETKPGTTTPGTTTPGTHTTGTVTPGAGTSTTSPKTGETSAVMVMALVAAAALGGMVYAKKANA